MLMRHYKRIMCVKSVKCQLDREVIQLQDWPLAKRDIYRVHNSYSFIMTQICEKNRYISNKFLLPTPFLVPTFVTKPTQITPILCVPKI